VYVEEEEEEEEMPEKEDRSRKAQGHVSNMQRGKKSSKYSSGADCIRKILCIIGD